MKKKRSFSSTNKKQKFTQKISKSAKPILKSKKPVLSPTEKYEIRLNKYIANTGLCSRREADEYILSGQIQVNGKKVSEFGTKITPKDVVTFKGKKLTAEKKVYILMNKPKDVITTTDDPQGRRTVFSIIKSRPGERIYPVGRLDRMTTGVLLLTNDGDLTKKLTHPKFQKRKIYQVTLNKALTNNDLEQIAKGVTLEDGFIKADAISFIDSEDKKQIGIEIHSGQNRVIRRVFEHLGYSVAKLDRAYFAGLTKKGLSRGHWRYLTNSEIATLKKGSYK